MHMHRSEQKTKMLHYFTSTEIKEKKQIQFSDCHYGMARIQDANGGDGLKTWDGSYEYTE
jgi:hypothetical protein